MPFVPSDLQPTPENTGTIRDLFEKLDAKFLALVQDGWYTKQSSKRIQLEFEISSEIGRRLLNLQDLVKRFYLEAGWSIVKIGTKGKTVCLLLEI